MAISSIIKNKNKNDRRTFNISNHILNNQDIILYNLVLSTKYNYLINIEVDTLVFATKYIHKYIYKRHDCTTMKIRNEEDEVKKYIDV